MTTRRIGLFTTDQFRDDGLLAAYHNEPALEPVTITSARDCATGLDGVIVAVPHTERFQAVSMIAANSDAPILTTAPVGVSSEECQSLIDHIGIERVASLNPLLFDPSIERMTNSVATGSDVVRTMFASWRRAAGLPWRQDLAQLLDLARVLTGSTPIRISCVQHRSSSAVLSLVRYANDAVLSLEVGPVLPDSLAHDAELLIDCFCQETAFQYSPGRQSITVDGASPMRTSWMANPAVRMVRSFLHDINAGNPPRRGLADDLAVLRQCDAHFDSIAAEETTA